MRTRFCSLSVSDAKEVIYMINKNELLSIVDEYDTPQAPVERHIAKKNGHWFRAVHVWIVNHKNQVLVQKRSIHKDQGAGLWEPAVAGHITSEDNYFTGALREVKEETGLNISIKDLKLVKIYKDDEFREYRGIFVCKVTAELHHIKFEKEEVDKIKLISINTLKKHQLYSKSDKWISHTYAREMFSVLN